MSWVGQVCERCFEWAACLDGICQECRPKVETGDPAMAPGLHTSWCLVCGHDIDSGDLCPRHLQEITAATEPGWRERYAS